MIKRCNGRQINDAEIPGFGYLFNRNANSVNPYLIQIRGLAQLKLQIAAIERKFPLMPLYAQYLVESSIAFDEGIRG